jgi:hypothetical protein
MQMGFVGSHRIEIEQNTTKCLREVMANQEVALFNLRRIELIFLGDMPLGAEHEVCVRSGDDIIRERIGNEFPPVIEHFFLQTKKTRCIRGNGA